MILLEAECGSSRGSGDGRGDARKHMPAIYMPPPSRRTLLKAFSIDSVAPLVMVGDGPM